MIGPIDWAKSLHLMQYNRTSKVSILGILLFNIKYYDKINKVYFIKMIIYILEILSFEFSVLV